jgi:hypothetical protein
MAQWNKITQDYLNQERSLFEVFICSDQFGNIGACGGNNQFEVNVSAGIMSEMSNVHKFGSVVTTSDTYDTVWTEAGAYEFPTTAGTITVVSTSTEDKGVGTGASTIVVQGLDANYEEIQETVSLNGTVGVAGTLNFFRTHRAFVDVGNSNVGNVTISIGGTVTCAIAAAMGQSQVAFYTVPAGKGAFLKQFTGTQNKNQDNAVRMFQRQYDENETKPFRLVTEINLYGSSFIQPYSFPIYFPPKTDIEVRAYTGSNATVSATFDMLVADNSAIGIGTT